MATSAPRKSQRDKRLIESLVRNHGPVSRVGIHKITKLRRSTISLLTRQLIAEGRLLEGGRSDNPLGRKQVLLRINPKFGFLVGVEFDDELITAGILDLEPAITYVVSERTDLAHGQQGLLQQLQEIIRRVVTASKLPWSQLIGIGIADPGLVDTRAGVTRICSTIDFWNQVPLRAYFEQAFHVPVLVESKTRSKTIAEQMLGGGEKQSNMIYVDYGTGIGAGVIVDGRLLYGQNCGAGEVGHTNVEKSGPTCKCGSKGCLEALVGASAVENRIRQALSEGVSSQVLAMAQQDPSRITAWLVFEAAKAGDKMCWNIVAEVAENLGIAIANLVNLFNPAIVLLDQSLRSAGDEFLNLVSRIVKSKSLEGSSSVLSLRFATLGRDSGLLGVGIQVLDKYYSQMLSGELPVLESASTQRNPVVEKPARKRAK